MARIDSKICFLVFGLLQLHIVTGQNTTAAAAVVEVTTTASPLGIVPPLGKEKTDQSTIVWAVSTDPLDPALSAVREGGQAGTNTSVVNIAATTQLAVAIATTTPASIRQETTAKVVTSAPIISTALPPGSTEAPPTIQQGVLDAAPSPTLHADVTDTVIALFYETGHPVGRNDTNVQEVVSMLMNGSVPTDADLMRMGFMPKPAPPPVSTPPPYSIPGNQPPLDTSAMFPSLPTVPQTGPSSGGSNGGSSPGGFSNPGYAMGGGFPANPPVGLPTGAQLPPQSGSGTGGTDPFAGTLTNIPNPPVMPNFMSMMGPSATTAKPALGDPFSMNTINGGTAAQLPNLGPIDPNALGPKPNTGPVGGLGTPGSTTDLLASLGPLPPGMGGLPPGMGGLPPGMGGLPPGMGGLPPSPPTGILDAPPPPRSGGGGMNPMMMMMMMNPEMMDMMLSGENPMLTYMFMQQMNKRPQRPRPAAASSMGPLSGFPGGAAGAGGLSMPFPGQSSPMAGASGGMMDMMNAMSAAGPGLMGGGPGTPMDLSALTGLGAGMGPTAGAPGNPMDLMQGSLSSSAGPGVPPTDLLPFPGMSPGLPSMTGPVPSGAPITDPFAATVG